jgi:exodeoxyribonuclease V alpha subunit
LSVLEAVLERITYANEDTGYTIARVATERTGADLLTVVGPLLGAQVGESLRLPGAGAATPATAGSSRCTPIPPLSAKLL